MYVNYVNRNNCKKVVPHWMSACLDSRRIDTLEVDAAVLTQRPNRENAWKVLEKT